MPDTRKKDYYWAIETTERGQTPKTDVTFALLMDLRDELKKLNRVFECPNALAIPTILRTIARNTRKPVKRVRKATK